MRFIVVYVLFAAFSNNLYSQTLDAKHFLIKGEYLGKGTNEISCSYRDSADKWVTKECKILNGRFSLYGSISGPTTMWLTSKLAAGSRDDPNWVEVFIEPGTMKFFLKENKFKSIKLNGSSIQDEYNLLEKSKLPIYTKMQPLVLERAVLSDSIDYFNKLKDTLGLEQIFEKGKLIFAQMAPFKSQLNQIEMSFVAHHPNDYLSAYLLEKQYMVYGLDKDTAQFYCANFSADVQNTYWIKSILMDIEKKEGSDVGATAKDFTAKDNKGLDITLGAFKNEKVVILDFWASWCIPCRESFPQLKSFHNKYQTNGLAIIAVSVDKAKAAWLKAIQADSTDSWNHVFALGDKDDIMETDVAMKYEIFPIPMTYLINKQGIIVGKWIGQSSENEEEINKKLQEIFGF